MIEGGKSADAIPMLEAALKQQSDNAAGHLQLGKAFEISGNPGRAESEYRESARLNPNNVEIHNILAGIGIRKADSELIRSSADQLIRLRPNDIDGYVDRAIAKANQNDNNGADADLKKAIEMAPNNPIPYTKLGLLREHQKKLPEAEKLFEQALDKDPNWSEAMAGLANVYIDQKQPISKTINRISAQVAKQPKNDSFLLLLAEAQLKAKDTKAAQSALEQALNVNPNNSLAMATLASIQINTGQVDQAAANYERIINKNPHSSLPLVMLGSLEESRGNSEKAKQLYQRALQVQPDQPLAANNPAYLLMQNGGNLDVALSLAQAARRGMPDGPMSPTHSVGRFI